MSILDRYGIKEVADVTFYTINKDGTPDKPVLYLDTLKVSTIEQTAETASAKGGHGNAELLMWDYGKEITLNLEDALFSPKSMAIMLGIDPDDMTAFNKNKSSLTKTVLKKQVSVDVKTNAIYFAINGNKVIATNVKFYDEKDVVEPATGKVVPDSYVYATGTIGITGQELTVSADKFPGTYYITGSTFARSAQDGQDEMFDFIIPKAKMLSEVTLTMEAEGDPSTFSMKMKVLRPGNGQMMKLVKYRLPKIVLQKTLKLSGNYDTHSGLTDSGADLLAQIMDNGVLRLSSASSTTKSAVPYNGLKQMFTGKELLQVRKIEIDSSIKHVNRQGLGNRYLTNLQEVAFESSRGIELGLKIFEYYDNGNYLPGHIASSSTQRFKIDKIAFSGSVDFGNLALRYLEAKELYLPSSFTSSYYRDKDQLTCFKDANFGVCYVPKAKEELDWIEMDLVDAIQGTKIYTGGQG